MATNLTIEDLDNGKLDLITLEEVSNVDFTGDTTQNRNSDTILTLSGAIKLLGFQPAVAHAGPARGRGVRSRGADDYHAAETTEPRRARRTGRHGAALLRTEAIRPAHGDRTEAVPARPATAAGLRRRIAPADAV